MNIHFKIPTALLDEVLADLKRPHPFATERLGFLAGKCCSSREGLLLIAHSYLVTPDDWYIDDSAYGCVFGPQAIRAAMQVCLDKKACMFHVHLHDHEGVPTFSRADLRESANFIPDFFNVRPEIPHGALVLSSDKAVGLCWYPGREKPIRINKFSGVGFPMRHVGRL
jgi:hypothetical protein